MAHFTSDQLQELLSGKHGLLALEAGREIEEKMSEIESLRAALASVQCAYNAVCADCNRAMMEASRAKMELDVVAQKYATLIATLKDLGIGEDGKKEAAAA